MKLTVLALSLFLPISASHAQVGSEPPAEMENSAPVELLDISPDQSDYQAGLQMWDKLKAAQSPVCDPGLDSYEVLTGKKTEYVALVIHGFTLYPRTMDHFVEIFAGQGMNVLVPRLARHYTTNKTDLDNVGFREWVKEIEAAYQAATRLGKRVVLVGYSLGGLLSMRMALAHPESANALFMFSPAIRMNPRASLGAVLGLTGMSYKGFNVPPDSCGKPYMSAKAGHQIERLMEDNERSFFPNGNYTSSDTSVYFQLRTPLLMSTVGNDRALDSKMIKELYAQIPSYWKGSIGFENGDHGLWVDPSVLDKVPEDSYRRAHAKPIRDEILQFLADVKYIDNLPEVSTADSPAKVSADGLVK